MSAFAPAPGDDQAVLQAALRAGRVSVDALSRATGLDPDAVQAAIARLLAAGYLSDAGSELRLVAPFEPLLATARRELEAQAAAAQTLARDLGALPAMVRDWSWGEENSEQLVAAERVEGRLAIIEAWWRYANRYRPVRTVNLVPNAAAFAEVPPADVERLIEYVGPHGGGIRIVVQRDSLADPRARAAVDGLRATGLQVRAVAKAATWYFADGDVVAALPEHWGDPWPTTVTLVRNAAIADAIAAHFETVWAVARELDDPEAAWDDILALLASGLTDDEIGVRLHLSERTVRRRVTEAMDEYGATNRFTLGVAWARRTAP